MDIVQMSRFELVKFLAILTLLTYFWDDFTLSVSFRYKLATFYENKEKSFLVFRKWSAGGPTKPIAYSK